MKILVYVDITETSWVPYEPDLAQWAKTTFTNSVVLTLDNHSENVLTAHYLKLMKEANQLIVIFNSPGDHKTSLGTTIKILQEVTHHTFQISRAKIVLLGKHSIVEKMGKILDEGKFIQTSSLVEAKKEISLFFNEC